MGRRKAGEETKTLISAKIEPDLLREVDEALPEGKTRTWAIEQGLRLLLESWGRRGRG